MIISPLQLNKYFFTKINLEASLKHSGKMGKISANLTCAHKDDDERQWVVTLKVILGKADDGKNIPPYTGELEILGFFTVDAKYPEENVQKLVHFNAPAMLYGAVREMVFNLTARGPNSHINLPTVSFLDNKPQEDKNEVGTGKKKTALKKKARKLTSSNPQR